MSRRTSNQNSLNHSNQRSIHSQQPNDGGLHNSRLNDSAAIFGSNGAAVNQSSPQLYFQNQMAATTQQIGSTLIQVEAGIRGNFAHNNTGVDIDVMNNSSRFMVIDGAGPLNRTIEMANSTIGTTQEAIECVSMVKGRFRVQERNINANLGMGQNHTITNGSNDDELMHSSIEQSPNTYGLIQNNFASAATGAESRILFTNQIKEQKSNISSDNNLQDEEAKSMIGSTGPFNRANFSHIRITNEPLEEIDNNNLHLENGDSPHTYNSMNAPSPTELDQLNVKEQHSKNGGQSKFRVVNLAQHQTPKKVLSNSGAIESEPMEGRERFLSNSKSKSYSGQKRKNREALSMTQEQRDNAESLQAINRYEFNMEYVPLTSTSRNSLLPKSRQAGLTYQDKEVEREVEEPEIRKLTVDIDEDHLADKEDNMHGNNEAESDDQSEDRNDAENREEQPKENIENNEILDTEPNNISITSNKEDQENEADGEGEDEISESIMSYEARADLENNEALPEELNENHLSKEDDQYFYKDGKEITGQKQKLSDNVLDTQFMNQNELQSDKSQQDVESDEQTNSISSLQRDVNKRNNRFVTRDIVHDIKKSESDLTEEAYIQFQGRNNFEGPSGLHREHAQSQDGIFTDLLTPNNNQQFEMKRIEWNHRETGEDQKRQISPSFRNLQIDEEPYTNKSNGQFDSVQDSGTFSGAKLQFMSQPLKIRLNSDANEFNVNNATMGQISSNLPENEDNQHTNIQVNDQEDDSKLKTNESKETGIKKQKPNENEDAKKPMSTKNKKVIKDVSIGPICKSRDDTSQSSNSSDKFVQIVDKDGKKFKLNIKDVKITISHSKIVFELPSGQKISAFVAGIDSNENLQSLPLHNKVFQTDDRISSQRYFQEKIPVQKYSAEKVSQKGDSTSKKYKKEETKKKNPKGPKDGIRQNHSESQRGESITSFKRNNVHGIQRLASNKVVDECEQKGRFLIKSSTENRDSSAEYQAARRKNKVVTEVPRNVSKKRGSIAPMTELLNSHEKNMSFQRTINPSRTETPFQNQSSSFMMQPASQVPSQAQQQMLQMNHFQQSKQPLHNTYQSGQSPISNLRLSGNNHESSNRLFKNSNRMYLESQAHLNIFGQNEVDEESSEQLTTSIEQRKKLQSQGKKRLVHRDDGYEDEEDRPKDVYNKNRPQANHQSKQHDRRPTKQHTQPYQATYKNQQSYPHNHDMPANYPHSGIHQHSSYDQLYFDQQNYQQSLARSSLGMHHNQMCYHCQSNNSSLQNQLIDLCKQQTSMFTALSQQMTQTVSQILDFARNKGRKQQVRNDSIYEEDEQESEESSQVQYVTSNTQRNMMSRQAHSAVSSQGSQSLDEDSGSAAITSDREDVQIIRAHDSNDALLIEEQELLLEQQQSIEVEQEEEYVYQHKPRTTSIQLPTFRDPSDNQVKLLRRTDTRVKETKQIKNQGTHISDIERKIAKLQMQLEESKQTKLRRN